MAHLGLVLFALLGLLNSVADSKNNPSYKIVCYLGSWANYRNGDGKFSIEDIDTGICTHLVYGFAKLGADNKIASYDPYLDLEENWGLGAYERFTNLKKKRPSLKTLIAIGGWNEGSTKYSQMSSKASSRAAFVQSVVEFCKKYGFDGLDMDWEYPANRGGAASDKHNFVLLLKELKEALRPQNLLLSAAVSAGQSTIDSAYDVPALGKYLDIINLMAYDFHGGWDRMTGHNSPLFARSQDAAEHKKLTVDYAVKYWLSKGAPSHKLVLGMPLYGRSFTLQDARNTGLGAPVVGSGMSGPYTREQGYLGYNEICTMLQTDNEWKVTRDEEMHVPYAVKDKNWVGYDDVRSIAKKVDYIIRMRLGGAMVWSIETDDFRGKCHTVTYPLLRTIYKGLVNFSFPTIPDVDQDNTVLSTRTHGSRRTETYTSTTGMTEKSSTVPIEDPTKDNVQQCKRTGYFRDPSDCQQFFLCQAMQPGRESTLFVKYPFICAAGTVFSERLSVCTFPTDVPECYHDN